MRGVCRVGDDLNRCGAVVSDQADPARRRAIERRQRGLRCTRVRQRLTERLGQQIVVDNRAGGAGIIGTEIVARAVPDGYTLLLAPTGFSINPGLYAKLPFDPRAISHPYRCSASATQSSW